MVRGTYLKSTLRMFSKHITRFLTIIAIMIVSIGFMSGLGEVEGKIDKNFQNYYISHNVSDLIIKNAMPLSSQQKDALTQKFGEKNVMFGTFFDFELEENVYRVYLLDLDDVKVNKFDLIHGNLPAENSEILVEQKNKALKSYDLHQNISLENSYLNLLLSGQKDFVVSGIVQNPLLLRKDAEPSINLENKNLDYVVYINYSGGIQTDAFVSFEDRTLFNSFSAGYKNEVEKEKDEIAKIEGLSDAGILSLYENYGIYSLHAYAQKVGDLSLIFVAFFLLVTSLVVFSTMTRLMDEERGQFACLKTLGYGNLRILSKYLLFILISCVIGGAIGLPVGIGLTFIIYSSFDTQYAMPKFVSGVSLSYFAITLAIILFASLVVTFLTGLKIVRSKPATLLTPKAPKAGKKVILEYIPFFWNRLSFKYKSTLRNVLLFRSRFYMTVVSIVGSTVLVLSGFGLFDNTLKLDGGVALVMLAIALVAFAGVLSALVIYNLANINISERNREIATLMVLGYNNFEVTGYVYREIYIMTAIGAVVGLPLSYLFMKYVFDFIDFGSVGNVNWYTWIIGPCAIFLFTFISTLLLYKKIVKTDMNESLKTLE